MAEQEAKTGNAGKLAVILVRGMVGMPKPVKDTLLMLNLSKKNYCVVVEDNAINKGMIKKVKDYITWGSIDNETFKELLDKKGEEYLARTSDGKNKYTYNFLEVDGKKYKKYFRLNPPKKGFGRKGIKMPFKLGGALGNRGNEINDLVKRML